MSRYESASFHRARCWGCESCDAEAEARKAERDGPIGPDEESARADQYERQFGL